MKKILLTILLLTTGVFFAQTPCVGGMAGSYPCSGYDLLSFIPYTDFGADDANDSWGWTDPNNGKEYALVGLDNGVAFVDITDPLNPVYLGKLPTHTDASLWRDIKTYNNYAFVVSEAFNHGMQVFDLTRLRNVTNPPVIFTEDAHYDGFGNAHNLVINESEGYAYGVGTNTYNGGPHFVNIQDPLNPVGEGGYSLGNYSHDGQVVTYTGPDSDYTGREIYVGSNEDYVVIADITDKLNPETISITTYNNTVYTHQGWFTEDQKYFLLGDEIDEITYGFNTRIIIFDFTDLDAPVVSFEYTGPTSATDHNLYIKGNEMYLANYKAGFRVHDISDIQNGNIIETGYFDVFPTNNNVGYVGAWNVYPYFGSGTIMVSALTYSDPSYIGGLYLLKSSAPDTTPPVAVCQNITVSLDANGNVIVPATSVDGGSSDNSGFYTATLNNNTFNCSDIGNNTVILTITDPSGNTATCNAVITVIDDLPPVVTCPADQTVEYDTGLSYYTLPNYIANSQAAATDNCISPAAITQSPLPGTQLTQGVYTVSFESIDIYDNIGSCTFVLTVNEVLSVIENELNSDISIFPNPASEKFVINSNSVPLEAVSVYDILGKKLFNTSEVNSETITVDISGYNKGIYFVLVNNSLVKKIIKQ
tara:strand:+ start:46082 stop:48019 length:1938 start_codon:yes stop_codon:yes gene_type:complete